MRVDHPKTGLLADRADPAVGGAPIEALAVLATEDRSFGALTDHQVEGPGGPRHQWDHSRLAAFAENPKGPVPVGKGHVLNIGPACLANPEAIEPEQNRQGSMILVAVSAVIRKVPNSRRSRPLPSDGWTLGRRTYWAGFAGTLPSMWANR